MKRHLAILLLIISIVPAIAKGEVLTEEPENFQPAIEAVACFVQYQDKILLLHRQDSKPQGGLWAAPGGKIDALESPLRAVARETFEETGIRLDNSQISYVGKYYITNDQSNCVLHLFETKSTATPVDIKLSIKEHKGFTWVTPEEALSMNLLPDEDTLIHHLYNTDKT